MFKAAGQCKNYFSMIYDADASEMSCSCCTEDPNEEANAPEANDNSTLYVAGGNDNEY